MSGLSYPAETTRIRDVAITNFSLPVEGKAPFTAADLRVAPKAPYTVDNVIWYENSTQFTESTFTAGKSYCAMIIVKPKSGYSFVWTGERGIDQFNSVTINGRTDFLNQARTAADLSVFTNAPYTVSEVEWYQSGTKLSQPFTFEEGSRYWARIYLEAKDGYIFDAQGDTVEDQFDRFTLNGNFDDLDLDNCGALNDSRPRHRFLRGFHAQRQSGVFGYQQYPASIF